MLPGLSDLDNCNYQLKLRGFVGLILASKLALPYFCLHASNAVSIKLARPAANSTMCTLEWNRRGTRFFPANHLYIMCRSKDVSSSNDDFVYSNGLVCNSTQLCILALRECLADGYCTLVCHEKLHYGPCGSGIPNGVCGPNGGLAPADCGQIHHHVPKHAGWLSALAQSSIESANRLHRLLI